MRTEDALRYAQERDLDLVEVAADAKPPVCRVLDYSKYKYEQAQKQKAARKHQQQITSARSSSARRSRSTTTTPRRVTSLRFLKAQGQGQGHDHVPRPRGGASRARGDVLERLAEELSDLAVVEQRPQQDGRNMTMMLGPARLVPDAKTES